MKDFKGTPGPWFVRHCDDNVSMNMTVVSTVDHSDKGHSYHENTDNDTVCIVFHQCTPQVSCEKEDLGDADAYLIAAAPDLLDALQTLLPEAEIMINSNHPAHIKAMAAIKKALNL